MPLVFQLTMASTTYRFEVETLEELEQVVKSYRKWFQEAGLVAREPSSVHQVLDRDPTRGGH